MLRASALFIVVFISLIIGILCSALITIAYLHNSEVYRNMQHTKLELNAYSAIQLLFADEKIEDEIIDLYGDKEDSVSIQKKSWGVFDVAVAKAFSGKYSIVKAMMYGYKSDTIGKAALYLADKNIALNICGTTTINGKAYLPDAGVKKVYVGEYSFIGDHYINGKIKKSKADLPQLNPAITAKLNTLLVNPLNQTARIIYSFDSDTLSNSFYDSSIIRYNRGTLRLDHKLLRGNIIVTSGKTVFIGRTAQLTDVIVIAPSVVIEDGFRGSVQVFAKDSILIGEDCFLEYPSAVGLLKSEFKDLQPFIKISQHSIIQGIVFTHSIIDDLKQTLISIGKDSRIEGQVYAQGFFDLEGTVYGTVYCTKFLLKYKSDNYENTLLNATIDRNKLSYHYVDSPILPSNNVRSYMKWLR